AEKIALDDALVAPANRLKIGKSNLRLSSDLKAKEATLQVQFEELPFEEAILTFLRDLGHSGEIKMITNVNVNKLHQPWRSFAAVINKCLSGKSTGYDSLRLSQAQIPWGMYHKKNVDYAYLLWEDFVYQVKTKNFKKSNEMYYPRFTKVIVNFFMTKDQSIPRRNSENWHYARDDYMFTTIKVVSRHEDTQLVPPKTKASVKKMQVKSDMSKTPPTAKGKRLKTSAKADKPAKKQPAKTSKAKGLMKSSEEDNKDEVNDDDNNDDDDNDDDVDKDINDDNADNQDDANQDDDEQTNSDNDGDDFVHPKLSTHDDEARKDDEVNEEESNEENNDEINEESDEEVQGANTEDEEMDEEVTHEEDEANELYRDMNVNLEGRDTMMTDALLPNVQATQETEDTHVIITAPVNVEGQQQSSLYVPVTTIAEPPLVSATTLPPPPTPLITHMQQTPFPIPTTIPSSSLQNLPNFCIYLIWSLTQCGVKCRSTTTNMHSGEFLIGGNSMDLLLTGNLLVMSTKNVESLLSQNFILSNDMATNIWIGSPFVEMMTSYIHSRKETSRGFAFKTSKIC
ncbi:hypothetical protein Tco_1398604, partial [Tanacetum coccineum]